MALQPLEFDLLVMLIRFKNCTLSRDRILDEVWGVKYIGARTVDTHIAQPDTDVGFLRIGNNHLRWRRDAKRAYNL